MSDKGLTKYCAAYKRKDAPRGSIWGCFIWAENYMSAWAKAKHLERVIPMIEQVSIQGVFLEDYNAGVKNGETLNQTNVKSLQPWFLYFQLDDYIEYENAVPDYDGMIKYFEKFEAYEICADLVKRKKLAKDKQSAN